MRTKKNKTYLLGVILNILAIGLSLYWFNWKFVFCIFLYLWANNIQTKTDIEDKLDED